MQRDGQSWRLEEDVADKFSDGCTHLIRPRVAKPESLDNSSFVQPQNIVNEEVGAIANFRADRECRVHGLRLRCTLHKFGHICCEICVTIDVRASRAGNLLARSGFRQIPERIRGGIGIVQELANSYCFPRRGAGFLESLQPLRNISSSMSSTAPPAKSASIPQELQQLIDTVPSSTSYHTHSHTHSLSSALPPSWETSRTSFPLLHTYIHTYIHISVFSCSFSIVCVRACCLRTSSRAAQPCAKHRGHPPLSSSSCALSTTNSLFLLVENYSKSSKRASAKGFFKIQQESEREGLLQNPARERERESASGSGGDTGG